MSRGHSKACFESRPLCMRMGRLWCERASSHRGPGRGISVWHGGSDTTVIPANADEILKQWTDVHGLADDPDLSGLGGWLSASGLARYAGERSSNPT